MNKLGRKLEYSLIALKHMSLKGPGELTSAKEVADRYRTPFDATARVMQMMAANGLLRSEQGAQGGYQLSRELEGVSMHHLIEMIQGPTAVAKCMGNEDACEIQGTCNITKPVLSLNKKLDEFYKNLDLGELIGGRL